MTRSLCASAQKKRNLAVYLLVYQHRKRWCETGTHAVSFPPTEKHQYVKVCLFVCLCCCIRGTLVHFHIFLISLGKCSPPCNISERAPLLMTYGARNECPTFLLWVCHFVPIFMFICVFQAPRRPPKEGKQKHLFTLLLSRRDLEGGSVLGAAIPLEMVLDSH